MTNRILITGATERPNGFQLGDGKYYGTAKLIGLDLDTGETEELIALHEGNEHCPAIHPNLQFTAGCVDGANLWLPTDTELRCYSLPSLKLERTISHPFFQNLHSVHVIDGLLVATSTGLDTVVTLDYDTGEPLSLINAEGKDTWHRFSPDVDYRLVHSTRPHDVHPNFVYKWNDSMWVTRCGPEDAVCLDDFDRRIDISGTKTIAVHDGHVVGDRVYFTSVDGCICVTDPCSLRIVETIDLLDLEPKRIVRGWCRGLLFDGDLVHVAFSRLRKTRNPAKLAWLGVISDAKRLSSASVVTYDLSARKRVREYRLPERAIHAIYSLLRA